MNPKDKCSLQRSLNSMQGSDKCPPKGVQYNRKQVRFPAAQFCLRLPRRKGIQLTSSSPRWSQWSPLPRTQGNKSQHKQAFGKKSEFTTMYKISYFLYSSRHCELQTTWIQTNLHWSNIDKATENSNLHYYTGTTNLCHRGPVEGSEGAEAKQTVLWETALMREERVLAWSISDY